MRPTHLMLASMLVALSLAASPATASIGVGGLSLDAATASSTTVFKALVATIGFGAQHRPYQPATPLGVAFGVDIGAEATLFKVPEALAASSPLPSMPSLKLQLHKGFTDALDLGGSMLYLPGNKLLGADAQYAFFRAEEGPTFSARLCYTYTDVAFNGINVSTKTFSPQVLASRQMSFADPYLGIALDVALGALDIESSHQTTTAVAGMAFGGIAFGVPHTGIKVTIEGSYNTAATHTLGLKAGFGF